MQVDRKMAPVAQDPSPATDLSSLEKFDIIAKTKEIAVTSWT